MAPFFCLSTIRGSKAAVGDWIVGTGAVKKYKYSGRLIFAVQIGEVMDFHNYWNDPRFVCKRLVLNGSLKQLYGDNIYHKSEGDWIQEDSYHSLDLGATNRDNLRQDTQNRVLIGLRFVYFGASAPAIPGYLGHLIQLVSTGVEKLEGTKFFLLQLHMLLKKSPMQSIYSTWRMRYVRT